MAYLEATYVLRCEVIELQSLKRVQIIIESKALPLHIYLFNNYWLRSWYVPNAKLDARDMITIIVAPVPVQSLSCVRLFVTPWIVAHQASLSITNSRSLPKPMSIELVMPSNHLILCCPLLLLPSIFPSIRVFSNESALRIRWPKYWSFSFSISPSNEYSGLISFGMDWLDLLAVSINSSALSFLYSPTLTSIHDHWKKHSLD